VRGSLDSGSSHGIILSAAGNPHKPSFGPHTFVGGIGRRSGRDREAIKIPDGIPLTHNTRKDGAPGQMH